MSDLIRRSDAIGVITNHCENECYYRVDSWCPQCQREEFQEAIKAIPSADRPQGEWKSVKASIYPYGYDVECSICGHRMGSSFGYKFCPMCGAKMKGAGDE